MVWGAVRRCSTEIQYGKVKALENGLVGCILLNCILPVGVWVLWMLSKEGAWCPRRSTALEAGFLHSRSKFASNLFGDLKNISSLPWVTSIKWRIWRGWFCLALWLQDLKGKWLKFEWDQKKNFLLVMLWRRRHRPACLPLFCLGWKRWNLIKRLGLEERTYRNCFLNRLILFVLIG